MRLNRVFGTLLALAACIVTIGSSFDTTAVENPLLFETVIENYSEDTHAKNSVTAIYLNYRVFDTIFEALMLLVSVMGVIHFSRHEHGIPKIGYMGEYAAKSKNMRSIALVIPIIAMLGFYLIINGHNTPGGGFQGGAALSAVFICVYLIKPEKTINFYGYERLEKALFLSIAVISVGFAVFGTYLRYDEYNIMYLIVMNMLIGIKVFCGLTIIFYRFVHYEDVK